MAGGLGERLGLDPVVVRLAFVVLAFAGGFGVVLYALAWVVSTDPIDAPDAVRARPRPGRQGLLAVGFVVAGTLLILRDLGVWPGDGLVVSVALAAVGSAIIWARGEDAGGPAGAQRAGGPAGASLTTGAPARVAPTTGEPRVSKLRLVAGALLVTAGMGTFLAGSDTLRAARNVAFGVAVAAVGAGLILGPWIWRMARQLAEERRERIRSEERADVAAHLHDSVLQTLAMIQRTDDANEMVTLARGQERELRAWLYGRGPVPAGADTLRSAVEAMAARVERVHRVPVEAVVVGHAPMDDRLRALVDAAGEAATNAARHSKAAVVSVYAEVDDGEVRAFVRDEGVGFVRGDVPVDRRGIADSIEGRMRRHGGSASISSEVGEGTEVQLRVPRRPS